MAITRRQVLGDVVTAYEVLPDDSELSSNRRLAQPDEETANALFERLMRESEKLAAEIKRDRTPSSPSLNNGR